MPTNLLRAPRVLDPALLQRWDGETWWKMIKKIMARNQMTTEMAENIGMSWSKPAHYEV